MISIEKAFVSVENGDIETLHAFVRHCGNRVVLNSASLNRTILHHATIYKNIEAIRCSLQNPRICNQADGRNRTALHYACYGGEKYIVKILLEHGADVNIQDDHGCTPLHIAITTGNPDIVTNLLHYGANIHLQDNRGRSAAHACLHRNRNSLLVLLIQHDANFMIHNDTDMNLQTILHKAAAHSDPDVALLVATHSPPSIGMLRDKDGNIPLHYAARRGHHGAARILLEKGCIADTPNNQGIAPLHLALQHQHHDMAILLLEYLADPMRPTPVNHDIGLHLAAQMNQHKLISHLMNAAAMIDHHIEVDLRNAHGRTPFMEACRLGNTKIASLFLSIGADWSLVDSTGNTAFLLAAIENHPSCLSQVIERITAQQTIAATTLETTDMDTFAFHRLSLRLSSPASRRLSGTPTLDSRIVSLLNHTNKNGEALLHWLCVHEQLLLVNTVLRLGADPNVINPKAQTNSLHYAAKAGNPSIVKLLLQKHVSMSLNIDGQSPLHYAARNGHADVCRILVNAGANPFAPDSQGVTPLRISSVCQHTDCEIVLTGVDDSESSYSGSFANRLSYQEDPLHAVSIHGS